MIAAAYSWCVSLSNHLSRFSTRGAASAPTFVAAGRQERGRPWGPSKICNTWWCPASSFHSNTWTSFGSSERLATARTLWSLRPTAQSEKSKSSRRPSSNKPRPCAGRSIRGTCAKIVDFPCSFGPIASKPQNKVRMSLYLFVCCQWVLERWGTRWLAFPRIVWNQALLFGCFDG